MNVHEIETELRLIERAIEAPPARRHDIGHVLAVQASWLLTALGRAQAAVTAAELAQAWWRAERDAMPPSPYGGSMSWEAGRATAVAYMSIGEWARAGEHARGVLIDFAEEDKAFYLFELCLQAQGRRPWNSTQSFVFLKNPAAQLASFDPRTYALEQYRTHPLPARQPDSADGAERAGGEPVPGKSQGHTWTRWSGVPVPPDLIDENRTAAQIHAERNDAIRSLGIEVYGRQCYRREVDALARDAERVAHDNGGRAADPTVRQFLMDYTTRAVAEVVERAATRAATDTGSDPAGTGGVDREQIRQIARWWRELGFALALLATPQGPAQWGDLQIPSGGWPWATGPTIRVYRYGPGGGLIGDDGYELHWSFGADDVCDAVDNAVDNGGLDAHRQFWRIAREWPELAHSLHQLLTAHGRRSPHQWWDQPSHGSDR